jgi:colanic acid/amylovoran biosynthesis glycosyltransferase
MRVAFLLPSFPAVSETFILRQITGLIDLGHDVDIYAEWRPDSVSVIHQEVEGYGLLARTTYTDQGMPAGTGYWQMPVWPIMGETWLPEAEHPIANWRRVARAAPVFFRALRAGPRLIRHVLDSREYGYQARSLSMLYRLATMASLGRKYDVLHAHFGPTGDTFRFARALWTAPLIVSFHGHDFTVWPRQKGPDAYRRLFDTVDIVTIHSNYGRNRIEELGCPPRKIRRLACGVKLDEFEFRARTREQGEPARILTVGRLVEKKGIEYAIRAVAKVRERHPDIRYDVVGDGPLRASMEQLIRDHGANGSITLHGAQDGNYVRQLMSRAHVFVLASVTAADDDQEGTPVSLIEAQAAGIPVLSTLHSAIPEIVADGRSGLLVPERDVEALAARLEYLLERPGLWPDMGKEGRRYVEENHDIRRLNRQLVDLYQDAMAEYRRNPDTHRR